VHVVPGSVRPRRTFRATLLRLDGDELRRALVQVEDARLGARGFFLLELEVGG
jgi:hypothetical protein